jgi:hypothetical protein
VKKIITYFFITIAFLLAIGLTYFNYGFPWNYYETKSAFKKHLANYSEEMMLEEVKFDIIHRTYYSYAIVKSKPKLRFFIMESLQSGEIVDGYEFEKTLTKARQDVIEILNEHIPERVNEGIELISLEQKELEINIFVPEKVEPKLLTKIVTDIQAKGFVVDQLIIKLQKE